MASPMIPESKFADSVQLQGPLAAAAGDASFRVHRQAECVSDRLHAGMRKGKSQQRDEVAPLKEGADGKIRGGHWMFLWRRGD